MSSYWIWDPHTIQGGLAVDLILTAGIIDQVNRPSRTFANHLLKDLGVDSEATEIRATPYRSSYYTDYPDSDDWRDLWELIWVLRIELAKRAAPIRVKDRQVDTDAIAASGSASPEGPPRVRCLIVADFRSDASLASAVATIERDEAVQALRRQMRQPSPRVSQFRIRRDLIQLRLDLGLLPRRFYSNDSAYARAVMDMCRKHKGTTHVKEREP